MSTDSGSGTVTRADVCAAAIADGLEQIRTAVERAEAGGAFPALVARGNRAGTQFHVEKSQAVGLAILANFLRWKP